MEMNQIRYFLAVCEELNFTRAADRCGVAQPSVTNGLRCLEQELGGPLFHRKPRVEPTDLGRAIRASLQNILDQAEHTRQAARTYLSCPPGHGPTM